MTVLAFDGAIEARGCGGSGCEDCPYAITGALDHACRIKRGFAEMSDVGWLLNAVDPELARRWSDYLEDLVPDFDKPRPDTPRRFSTAERAEIRELVAQIQAVFEESPPQLEAVRAVFPGVDRAPLGPEAWISDTTLTVYGLARMFRLADEHGLELCLEF